MPAETLTYGRVTRADETDAFDFVVTDLSGNPIVEIGGYVMRTFVPKRSTVWTTSERKAVDRRPKAMIQRKQGLLDSFEYKKIPMQSLGPGQARIEVRAAGLNFRDVLLALGQMPAGEASRGGIGGECSGVVSEVGHQVKHVRPGDRVVAVSENCFATEVVVDADAVTCLPQSLTYTDGSSIPITFMTVDYAFNDLARLQEGERVLIHSAAGGIGLAAVQMARDIGAEIFATAGSDAKRDYLRGMGINHVMDSRSLDFVEEIKDATDGDGVDVVLNALAGEYITAGISLLKPFGRFLEIGKRDIYADFKMGLYPFRNNLTYFGVDLGQLIGHRPTVFREKLAALMRRFAMCELRPSPVKVFLLSEIGEGFEHMALARHIGKIVFSVESGAQSKSVALDRFIAEYGTGIRVSEGLKVFDRLIASDETPPYVMAVGETLAGNQSTQRYQAQGSTIRPVDTEYREPRNANEERLKQIWESILGVSPIGIDDDFIALGGDSINAIMIQVAVEQDFGMDLPFSVLFRHPSIAQLGDIIVLQSGDADSEETSVAASSEPASRQSADVTEHS